MDRTILTTPEAFLGRLATAFAYDARYDCAKKFQDNAIEVAIEACCEYIKDLDLCRCDDAWIKRKRHAPGCLWRENQVNVLVIDRDLTPAAIRAKQEAG